MNTLKLDIRKVLGFLQPEELSRMVEQAGICAASLENRTGKGKDFLGWVNLPSELTPGLISDIEETAHAIRQQVDAVVVIGIGGSYLGTRAVAEALSHSFLHLSHNRQQPFIFYAGQNLSEDYLHELIEVLDTIRYALVVISKSGTTTEPAVAFRLLKNHLESKAGIEQSRKLTIAITDAGRGALLTTARQEGYKTYVIPDDVGGRYSVLTPVGLVPLAIGGFNIRSLTQGALEMEKICHSSTPATENPACLYAAARTLLYRQGKKVEILANFENKLHFLAEWWKQLYGESEGKEGMGIFPSSVDYTADLHSMGQYVQEGERHLIETVISIEKPAHEVVIPSDSADLDGLNYLAGRRVDEVNKMAELGTMLAHVDGGVPNIHITLPQLSERYIGQLMYFFEKACGISGYLLDVNPFDQPGVEAYKKNMFALLNKPGFEEEGKELRKQL